MNLIVNREDPRVRRTHRLLIESFGKLLKVKTYETISVTDITREADVNRATFYAHFTDKKELFEEVVLESFKKSLSPAVKEYDKLNEKNVRRITTSLYQYLGQLEGKCSIYNDATKLLVENIIKITLSEFIYYKLQHNRKENISENVLRVNAAMIGNAICAGTCIGQSTDIELLADEICYMVLPKINSLTNP